ncbi:MAG: hypothetical protein DCC52_16625 [Chloroflexi bacterium]|nr:MAG: hypothetical protein DCC52_16625 [Chloroflexota bacterium]
MTSTIHNSSVVFSCGGVTGLAAESVALADAVALATGKAVDSTAPDAAGVATPSCAYSGIAEKTNKTIPTHNKATATR